MCVCEGRGLLLAVLLFHSLFMVEAEPHLVVRSVMCNTVYIYLDWKYPRVNYIATHNKGKGW